MILLNSNKSNKNLTIEAQICEYESKINFSGLKCSCGSTEFNYHGTYERNVIDIDKEYKINIKRVKCVNCKSTHALIPEFLLTYYQTKADIIIDSVKKMEEEGKSTTDVEKESNISRQKLNQWRIKYRKLINTIRETFSKIVKIEMFYISENRVRVYHSYKPIFLMQQTT